MNRNRQALGVLSNNFNYNQQQQQQLDGGVVKQQLKQQSAATATVACSDENEQPSSRPSSQQQQSSSQQDKLQAVVNNALKSTKTAADFDFEIYQEDVAALLVETNKAASSSAAVNSRISPLDKENKSAARGQQHQHNKAVYFDLNEDDEEDEEDDDDDVCAGEQQNEEEREDDDEYDDYQQDENEEEEEEEGISRLNLAVINDTNSVIGSSVIVEELSTYKEKMNTSGPELSIMMDSSASSSIHVADLSPMILDDTIKFQSHSHISSSMSHVEDYQEEVYDEEEEQDDLEEDEEETIRRTLLAEHENLVMSCLEYKDDILAYMRHMELENRPKANYMKKQQDINSSMRSILVDWLVEVSEEYKLNVETLYLAINYTDRFLSQMSVLRGKLQLVGTASMYIASKYEEITPPDVSEFVYITDDTYTKKQVLRMEHLLLKVLDFKMNTPTANCFLNHYFKFGKRFIQHSSFNDLEKVEHLAKYLTELTLIDGDTFMCYLPSQVAASAIYLSLLSYDKPWSKQLADSLGYGYDLNELKACIVDMHKAMQNAPSNNLTAIFDKYKNAKHNHVALVTPPKSLPFSSSS